MTEQEIIKQLTDELKIKTDALGEAESLLKEYEERDKNELIETLIGLTGGKKEDYAEFDEEALIEMIKLAQDKKEKSKGLVKENEEEKMEEDVEEVLVKNNEITFTEDGFTKFDESIKNLKWLENVRWIPKGVKGGK